MPDTTPAHAAPALTVGEPDVAGPLAVFPVFGPPVRLEYCSFAEASALGATVTELEGGASVNDLVATNPLDVAMLLYEGEEVRGAQQDRTLDVSVLVAAGGRVEIPVSCVEHGRWDSSRHGEAFAPAPAAAFPELRKLKNRAARASNAARAQQGEVWDAVARKSARHQAASPTGAMRDVFDSRRSSLDDLTAAISRRDGQLGAVACVAGEIVVLDWVGRADVYAALHAPLTRGYALDALEAVTPAAPPAQEAVQAFVDAALTVPRRTRPAVGMGTDIRFATSGAEGAALTVDDELVTLTAFPGETPSTRVRRPSRRHP